MLLTGYCQPEVRERQSKFYTKAVELEMMLRMLLGAALGAITGYRRERAGKIAGLCLTSAVNTVLILVLLFLPHPIR